MIIDSIIFGLENLLWYGIRYDCDFLCYVNFNFCNNNEGFNF